MLRYESGYHDFTCTIWSDLSKGQGILCSHGQIKVSQWLNVISVAKQQQSYLGRLRKFFMPAAAKVTAAVGSFQRTSLPGIHPLPSCQPIRNGCLNRMSITFWAVWSLPLAFKWYLWQPWPTPGWTPLFKQLDELSGQNVGQCEEDTVEDKQYCFDRCGKALHYIMSVFVPTILQGHIEIMLHRESEKRHLTSMPFYFTDIHM